MNPVASGFSRKDSRSVVVPVIVFAAVAGGLFAINMAISGEWNYQGGERASYYYEFPFQNDVPQRPLGIEKSRGTALTHIILPRPRR